MSSVLNRVSMSVRWGFLGLVSGLLSCAMTQSSMIYLAREQKTLDHIVWPGMVFGLVVLLPMSRWAGDSWLRTAAALIASSAAYPIAWRMAAVSLRHSAPFMIASFACAGFLGSCVLASVFLVGRPRWGRAAITTVILGTAVGGLMGAHLRFASTIFLSAGDVLGLYMVLWQTAVGASLGRGVKARSSQLVEARDGAPNPGDAAP